MKAKRVSVVAKGVRARAQVFAGRKQKTVSGLTRTSLIKNKRGKIVSKASAAAGKKKYSNIKGWTEACQKARNALQVTGFCPVGGKSAQGKALYAKAKAIQAMA